MLGLLIRCLNSEYVIAFLDLHIIDLPCYRPFLLECLQSNSEVNIVLRINKLVHCRDLFHWHRNVLVKIKDQGPALHRQLNVICQFADFLTAHRVRVCNSTCNVRGCLTNFDHMSFSLSDELAKVNLFYHKLLCLLIVSRFS